MKGQTNDPTFVLTLHTVNTKSSRFGQVITAALNDYVMATFGGGQTANTGGGWLSSLTSMVGGIFLTSDETQPVIRGQRNR